MVGVGDHESWKKMLVDMTRMQIRTQLTIVVERACGESLAHPHNARMMDLRPRLNGRECGLVTEPEVWITPSAQHYFLQRPNALSTLLKQ